MNQPPRPFFTVTGFGSLSVTTAFVQGDILTIAKDDHSLSLPTLIALDIAAETMWRLGHSSYRAAVRYQGLVDGRAATIAENLSKLWKESSSGGT
jgi:hypothetical protein